MEAAKIYFIIFGLLTIAGGVVGYVKAGSVASAGAGFVRRAFCGNCLSLDLARATATRRPHGDIRHRYTGTNGHPSAGDHGKIGHDKTVQWHHASLCSRNDLWGRCRNGTHRSRELRARFKAPGARAFTEQDNRRSGKSQSAITNVVARFSLDAVRRSSFAAVYAALRHKSANPARKPWPSRFALVPA